MSDGLAKYVFNPDDEPPEDKPTYQGLIYAGDSITWLGREKHRKSNLALQQAMCAALGRDFLNFPFVASAPLRVVLVDYESKKRRFWQRYNAICDAMHLTAEERATLKANLKVILVREVRREGHDFPRFPVQEKPKKELQYQGAVNFWKGFASNYPADMYIFDPMRSVHAEQENDSTIEMFLSKLRTYFGEAVLIVLHHLNKGGNQGGKNNDDGDGLYFTDMRDWALRRCRGSTAIGACADVIMCQLRRMEDETEVVYLGAYMRDESDIEPLALTESDDKSFYWCVTPKVPEKLRGSFEALRKANRTFKNRDDAAKVIHTVTGKSRATSYRHVGQLMNAGVLRHDNGDGGLSIIAEVEVEPTLDEVVAGINATRGD